MMQDLVEVEVLLALHLEHAYIKRYHACICWTARWGVLGRAFPLFFFPFFGKDVINPPLSFFAGEMLTAQMSVSIRCSHVQKDASRFR